MATLKISDLSVGDWVRVGEECSTISSIYHNGAVYADEVALTRNGICTGVKLVSELRPIPITAEVLEKNGFVKNGEYNEWNIGTWRTPHLLGVSLERPAITIKWNGSSIFIDQAKYIHQLQHALRLAGVDKEIDL
jgi:hypothetical protein